MFKSYKNYTLVMLLVLLITSCSSVTLESRIEKADQIASNNDWEKRLIYTKDFIHVAYLSPKNALNNLTIYIEGDGFAWVNKSMPSSDPTPITPYVLSIATNDLSESIAYLARPCQYTMLLSDSICQPKYWTSHRFSAEIINSTNEAIEKLKLITGATKLQLIGYSGGGAIATLVATNRSDVTRLITIAGNLDHKVWTNTHNITNLTGSLNPADYWYKLTQLKQIHFIGEHDHVMPKAVADAYLRRFPADKKPIVKVVPRFDHYCCWESSINKLLKE